MGLHLISPAFSNNSPIPSLYTCDGKNISPPLQWEGLPAGTKSLVLIVDDPDAPKVTWTHWVVYNISPKVIGSLEGFPPEGGRQGKNDFGKFNYGGPCPPKGVHRYFFKLYALDTLIKLPAGATKQEIEEQMKTHILEQTQLVGTYSRDNAR